MVQTLHAVCKAVRHTVVVSRHAVVVIRVLPHGCSLYNRHTVVAMPGGDEALAVLYTNRAAAWPRARVALPLCTAHASESLTY